MEKGHKMLAAPDGGGQEGRWWTDCRGYFLISHVDSAKRKAGKKTVIRSRPQEILQSSTENLFLQVDGLLW